MTAAVTTGPRSEPLGRSGPSPWPLRLTALGVLLLQVVWVFAVPPFRGSDEFDHAYRVDAVVHGQWAPDPTAATRGTGAWLLVDPTLVRAARAECQKLPYTVDADCVGTAVGQHTRVASAAGRYHPLFYEVVGLPSLPFSGATALYAMRLTAALLCWAMFVAALAATRTWARTRWPYLALVVASTPTLLYSTSLPAPNGLEMMAGLTLIASVVGLLQARDRRRDTGLLVLVAVSGCLLVTLRSLGPLWCALVVLTALVGVRCDRDRLRQVVLGSRGWAAASLVLVATVGSVLWIRSMGALTISEQPNAMSAAERLSVTLSQVPAWILQSVAAFPIRNEASHPLVYATMFLLGTALLTAGLIRATNRLRLAILLVVAVTLVVPVVLTFSTVESFGVAWQGRYGLPYSVSCMVLAGFALDRNPPSDRLRLTVVGAPLYVVGQTLGPVLVAVHERGSSPGVANGDWVLVPVLVLVIGAGVGSAIMWIGAATTATSSDGSRGVAGGRGRPARPGWVP